jgi:hypothetical protein
VAPVYPDIERHVSLPEAGKDKEWVQAELEKLRRIGEGHWETGRVSGAVYHGGEDLSDVIRDCTLSILLPPCSVTYPTDHQQSGNLCSQIPSSASVLLAHLPNLISY